METLLRDIRYGIRTLLRNPGFTAVALLTLLLGIGASSAVFSVINAVLLRPLPYPGADRIVRIWGVYTQRDMPPLDAAEGEYLDYREQSRSFEALGAYVTANANLTGSGEPERVKTAYASAGLFETLGVQPVLGRTYKAEEELAEQGLVVLSNGLWRRRFGADPGIVGKDIELMNRGVTVIGVMPPGFDYPDGTELWSPLGIDPAQQTPRTEHYLSLVARLAPGVGLERATADLNRVARSFGERFPVLYPPDSGWSVRLVPLLNEVVGDTRPALLVLAAAVAMVLLIACVNVASLLLARAQARARELTIRVTMGATRGHLIRQTMTETLLLSLAGGALGLLLAQWAMDAFLAVNPDPVPRAEEIGLDWRVVAFAAGLSLLTGIVLGLVPALRALRTDARGALQEGGRAATAGVGHQRFRQILVGLEVALALMLLVSAGLMIKSFLRMQRVDPGFRAERLLTMELALGRAKYPEDRQAAQFFDRLLDRLNALPGIRAASAVSFLPFSQGISRSSSVGIEGRPYAPGDPLPEVDWRAIDPRYFHTMGVPLVQGRGFQRSDDGQSVPVAVVDQVAARRLWPNESPIGKRVRLGAPDNESLPWVTVVGVAGEVKQDSLTGESQGAIYMPLLQRPDRFQYLVLRTETADPLSVAPQVRQAVLEMDRDQPAADVASMEQRIWRSLARPRLAMLLLSVFAGVAVVLASVGIYGVVAYSVTQRTHEIGVRMALGARRSDIFRLIVRQGMAVALAGVLAGLLAAFWLARGMASLLFGVATRDAAVFASVPLLLALVALAANLLPARRAASLEPTTALRYE